MTVDKHEVADPPIPGGARMELIRGTVTVSGGVIDESITLNLSYDDKPVITTSAGNGATDEEVTATLQDDDPSSDSTITIQVTASTDEDKEYHVQVIDLLGDT